MDDWLRRADEEMARRHPRRWAAPRVAFPSELDVEIEPEDEEEDEDVLVVEMMDPPSRRATPASDPHLDLVRAGVSWLVAYYAQETDDRRCRMATGFAGLPAKSGPERRPSHR